MALKGQYKDISGLKFGNLTVLYKASENSKRGALRWVCSCFCGKETTVEGSNLRTTKSCGCLQHLPRPKHGHASGGKLSSEYESWAKMKNRCLNTNIPDFKNYGGRGITLCERWKDSFINFRGYGTQAFTNLYFR